MSGGSGGGGGGGGEDMRGWGVSHESRSYKGLVHYLEHTPSIAFRHLPPQEEGGKPGIGVCISS